MRGQTQGAAAQGLQFRNIRISAAAMRQGLKWQKVITKGKDLPLYRLRRAVEKGGWRMEIQVSSVPEQQQAHANIAQIDV